MFFSFSVQINNIVLILLNFISILNIIHPKPAHEFALRLAHSSIFKFRIAFVRYTIRNVHSSLMCTMFKSKSTSFTLNARTDRIRLDGIICKYLTVFDGVKILTDFVCLIKFCCNSEALNGVLFCHHSEFNYPNISQGCFFVIFEAIIESNLDFSSDISKERFYEKKM